MSPRRGLALLALLAALALAADAGWIQAKAWIAQMLLKRSWDTAMTTGHTPAPWPWADTRPVARLSVPALGVDQFVLAGDNGRALAFGPGWAEASARPGSAGQSVLSGHRDTHFAWLRHLQAGDELLLESAQGSMRYRVERLQVADAGRHRLELTGAGSELVLVTCWPFDAVAPGGPLRYVVFARAIDAGAVPQPRAEATASRIREITSA